MTGRLFGNASAFLTRFNRRVFLISIVVMTTALKSYGDGNSLFDAIRSGDVRQVRNALSRGVDPNRPELSGQTPLILAAAVGRVEIVRLLLDRRASINTRDEAGATALMRASTSGQHRLGLPAIKLWAYDHICLFGWPVPSPTSDDRIVHLLTASETGARLNRSFDSPEIGRRSR